MTDKISTTQEWLIALASAAVVVGLAAAGVWLDYRAGVIPGTTQGLLERFVYYGAFLWSLPAIAAVIADWYHWNYGSGA